MDGVIRRKRGRPRSPEPMERFFWRLPPRLYDALCREAIRKGVDVPKLAREILDAHLSRVENGAAANLVGDSSRGTGRPAMTL